MTIRSLRWQGPSRREACRKQLHDRLAAWQRDWCVGTVPVTVAAPERPSPSTAARWQGGRHADASVWLASETDGMGSFGAALAGEGSADSAGLAEALARRALDDLVARLLGAAPGAVEALGEPEARDLDARHGAAIFELGGLLAGHRLLLDAAMCDALVPRRVESQGALAQRTQAVLSERVSFDVALPLGEQSLSDSVGLKVGEVLLAGDLATSQIKLLAASGRTVASGALTRSGECRALRIEYREDHQGMKR
jgi:hypothetical protein